jgi:hypothetical protein
MRSLLTLALSLLLCTCGRAQIDNGNLPRDQSSVAFIKSPTGFLIDSLTIATSLDTVPYGFAFSKDTIIFNVSIFQPVDELIVETFALGRSFGRYNCWVDAPSADVHLSIAAGRTLIDSVRLSPVEAWFRKEVAKIRSAPDLTIAKEALKLAILDSRTTLMSTKFIEAFYILPNLTRFDVSWMQVALNEEQNWVKRHPWFTPLLARQKVMQSKLLRRLHRYQFEDQSGKIIKWKAPKKQFYVLDFYDARTTVSRRDHEALRKAVQTDSVLSGVPIISITRGDYVDGWRNYLREGDFPWPHYLETSPPTGPSLFDELAFFPASTYILVNRKNRIEGLFSSLQQLQSAVELRKQAKLTPKGRRRK